MNNYIPITGRMVDITGMKFGRLTAIGPVRDGGKVKWHCRCDCGNDTLATVGNLKSGNTQSCHCLRYEAVSEALTKHGMTDSREYRIWSHIKDRCYNPNDKSYHRYGARGISICDRWLNSFENFYADVGEIPHGLTLDRIDNDGNYEPENVRVAPPRIQANNRANNRVLTFNGESLTLAQWSRKTGIRYVTLSQRLNAYGWSVEKTLTTPVRRKS